MKINPEPKIKWLHLRLSQSEFNQLEKQFKTTTERKMSGYSRKILLGKPMILGHRNLDAEALITQFSILIKTLNGIANNYNQAVHVLHTLKSDSQFLKWFLQYENDRSQLLSDVRTMREYMNQNASKWLQE